MIRRDHASREAAIREAMAHDYRPLHRRDGLLVFARGKGSRDQVAVARETRPRSVVFHLVDPPADTVLVDASASE